MISATTGISGKERVKIAISVNIKEFLRVKARIITFQNFAFFSVNLQNWF